MICNAIWYTSDAVTRNKQSTKDGIRNTKYKIRKMRCYHLIGKSYAKKLRVSLMSRLSPHKRSFSHNIWFQYDARVTHEPKQQSAKYGIRNTKYKIQNTKKSYIYLMSGGKYDNTLSS